MSSITEMRRAYRMDYPIRPASGSQRIEPITRVSHIIDGTQKSPEDRHFHYTSKKEIARQIREGNLDIFA